jgi:hypothetical protein
MKSWITESEGLPAVVYLGATPESNTVHLGINENPALFCFHCSAGFSGILTVQRRLSVQITPEHILPSGKCIPAPATIIEPQFDHFH